MENCLNIYNEFLENVQENVQKDFTQYKENITERLDRFYKSLQHDDIFTIFSLTKIKVFSSKTVETHNVSISLLDEKLTLKDIFNNQSEHIKNELWELLLNLYIQLERINNNNEERITQLKTSIKQLRNSSTNNIKSDMLKNVLNTDVNNTTNNMLDDIIGSFQDITSNKNKNPFESIMGITEMITNKYASGIESGEVELDKILGGMTGLLNSGGVGDMFSKFGFGEEKKDNTPVIIDDNFSTADIDVGSIEEKSDGFNFNNLSKLMPLAGMVSKINSIKSEDDINSLKNEMDQFMEKELKVDMSQYKENIDKLSKKLDESKLKDKLIEAVCSKNITDSQKQLDL